MFLFFFSSSVLIELEGDIVTFVEEIERMFCRLGRFY